MAYQLTEQARIVDGIPPQTNAGAITGRFISLQHLTGSVYIVVQLNQLNATPPALTLLVGTQASPQGTVAIPNTVPIWLNNNTLQSDGLVRQVDAVSFTPDATLATKLVVFKVKPEAIAAGGYWSLVAKVGASSSANIVAVSYICVDVRYQQTSPPNLLTS